MAASGPCTSALHSAVIIRNKCKKNCSLCTYICSFITVSVAVASKAQIGILAARRFVSPSRNKLGEFIFHFLTCSCHCYYYVSCMFVIVFVF